MDPSNTTLLHKTRTTPSPTTAPGPMAPSGKPYTNLAHPVSPPVETNLNWQPWIIQKLPSEHNYTISLQHYTDNIMSKSQQSNPPGVYWSNPHRSPSGSPDSANPRSTSNPHSTTSLYPRRKNFQLTPILRPWTMESICKIRQKHFRSPSTPPAI